MCENGKSAAGVSSPRLLGSAQDALRRIANIAHHGGLMGMDAFTAVREIRKISLPWWDRDECNLRQKPNNSITVRRTAARECNGSTGGD